jgi:uncharacterized membrane protein YdjX (TVP38/TMEM64 family)
MKILKNKRSLAGMLLLLGLIVAGAYIFLHHDLHVYLLHKDKAIALIKSCHPYDEWVFMALQALQVLVAPIPGDVTGLIGGYLYGPLLGTIYSTIGLTIGSWLAFILARIFGEPLVERAVRPEVLKKYDYVLEHQGVLVSFILFLIPGFPKDYLCYLMGLSHMKTSTFLIISTVGRLFGTILLSVCGSNVRTHHYRTLLVILVVSGVVVVAAYIYREKLLKVLRKKHKQRRRER